MTYDKRAGRASRGEGALLAPPADPPHPDAEAPVGGVLWEWRPSEADLEPTRLRPRFDLDPGLVLPAPPVLPAPLLVESPEEEARFQLLVAAGTRRRRRRTAVRGVLVAAVVGACAVLPFVAPQVPEMFASAVPDPPAKADPPIAPPDAASPDAPLPPIPPGIAHRQLEAAGKPLEVTIKRLGVASEVVPISGRSGALVPPEDPQLLGWWQEGREAGVAAGSVVITGHTVNRGGGAFDNLGKLVRGDRISVRTAAGRIDYVVTVGRDLTTAELAADATKIFTFDGPGRLVLITCSDWDGEIYRSNAVVYATPVHDVPAKG